MFDTFTSASNNMQCASKILRKDIVNDFIKSVEYHKMNKYLIGNFTRILHNVAIFVFILFVLLVKIEEKEQIIVLLIILALIIISSMFFNGCLITVFEYKLTNIDVTPADCILRTIGYDATNENRKMSATIVVAVLFIILFFKYIYR